MSHGLAGGLRLIASFGTAFRGPTFNELYYPFFAIQHFGRALPLSGAWNRWFAREASGRSIRLRTALMT